MHPILRIDDIGASSKMFNQYGLTLFKYKGFPFFYFPFSNWLFIKRIWPFKGWGPYEELTAEEWQLFLKYFEQINIVPLIAVTAAWVEIDGSLTPFPEKFPAEADILKRASQMGKIIVANHGLTHCVVGRHLPRAWQANRESHREFWPNLPQSLHDQHIFESQKILETFFETKIDTFVPPGNVWSYKTYLALKKTNITKVICNRLMSDSNKTMDNVQFIDDRNGYIVIHDRDLKLYGKEWLESFLRKNYYLTP